MGLLDKLLKKKMSTEDFFDLCIENLREYGVSFKKYKKYREYQTVNKNRWGWWGEVDSLSEQEGDLYGDDWTAETIPDISVDPDFHSGKYGKIRFEGSDRSGTLEAVLYGDKPWKKSLQYEARKLAGDPDPATRQCYHLLSNEEMTPEKAREMSEIAFKMIKNYAKMDRIYTALLENNEELKELTKIEAEYARKIDGINKELVKEAVASTMQQNVDEIRRKVNGLSEKIISEGG